MTREQGILVFILLIVVTVWLFLKLISDTIDELSDYLIKKCDNDQEWAKYEDNQSDIFDHILAVIPAFDLKVFQQPTGQDFANLNKIN